MGSIDNLNSSNTALNADESFSGQFSALTNYSEICISVETDKNYTLILHFSSNGSDIGFTTTYANKTPSAGVADLYFSPPNMRYLQVILENTDATDQSYLRLQTLLKSNTTFQFSSGPSADVNIIGPLDGSGFVEVSVQNAVDISGSVSVSGNTYDDDGNLNVNAKKCNIFDSSGNTINTVENSQITYAGNSLQVIDTHLKYTRTTPAQLDGVIVCVSDSLGNNIITDVSNNLLVNVANAVNVSGTVSVSGNTYDDGNLNVNATGSIVNVSDLTFDLSSNLLVNVANAVNVSGSVDISGQTVLVDISGQTVDISGQTVDISGQSVVVSGTVSTDISGQTVLVDISGQTVDISGQTVDISGQSVVVSGTVSTDISGQTVLVDISGQTVDISGQSVVVSGTISTDISGQSVVVSGTVSTDISGQKVDISGQSVVVSGTVSTDISGQTVLVDISGQTVVVDISGQTVDISGQTVDISGQTVIVSSTDISTIATSLNNQRISANVWNNSSVVQNGQSSVISPGTYTYCNTTLSCYGTSSQDATIAVQFSNNGSTFYTTQYQYTLTAGNFGFSLACSAYHIRLILLSAITSTITAYIDIC